jgi:6-pyruvoyl-tetrahydropterin synthase
MKDNPTAENMSKLLYEICSEFIPNVRLDKVVVYETPTSFAEYTTTNELPF